MTPQGAIVNLAALQNIALQQQKSTTNVTATSTGSAVAQQLQAVQVPTTANIQQVFMI